MEPFTRIASVAAALPEANIDTDVIFPARFLVVTEKAGLGRYAFHDKRCRADGSADPAWPMARAPFDQAQILVAGDNFGCGSSREQAPWALRDLGIRCVVSSRFGEIFEANCVNNGILPVTVAPAVLASLLAAAARGEHFDVDLDRCRLAVGGDTVDFAIADWRRAALLSGQDEIASVLQTHGAAIDAFEARQRRQLPWLWQTAADGMPPIAAQLPFPPLAHSPQETR